MTRRTVTYEIRTNRPGRVVEGVRRQLRSDTRSGLVFVSGELSSVLDEVAEELARATPGVNWLILPTLGVLTERGEIGSEPAATALLSGLLFRNIVASKADPAFGALICEHLDQKPGATAFVGVRGGDDSHDGWLDHVDHHFRDRSVRIFGGGLLPNQAVCAVEDGRVRSGAAACTIIPAGTPGRFRTSAACRLISPLMVVTQTRGPSICELDGGLALERLNEATSELTDQPLVLLAVAAGENPLSAQGRHLVLRAIHGVDPGRGALIFDEPIPEGARVAFAVRDAHASRRDLEAQVNALRLECAGAVPEFGILVNCKGRGVALYQSDNVDLRLIKRNFPDMPLIGMHSTFEIGPFSGRTVPQIYSAVVGVFCRPS
jgi:small ligand-binding sensory domain FIST